MATTEVTAASTATLARPNSFNCCFQYCCSGFRDHVLPFILLFGFGIILLLVGPLYAFVFAIFVVSFYLESRERNRRIELANRPSSNAAAIPQPAAAKETIDLALLVVRTIQADEPTYTCEICLDDFQQEEQVAGSANPDCIHEFHVECIHRALQRQSTCPCCRREYLVSKPPSPDVEQAGVVPVADAEHHDQSLSGDDIEEGRSQ